jgi:mannose-6-phosphate isomerase
MLSLRGHAPLVLEPKLTSAIWGGHALVERYGKAGDPAAILGESWECYDENAIANGPLSGATLAQARADLGSSLMGPLDASAAFPVLTKIIDAREPLSVQVHPDDAYARRVEGQPNGKTECWYILACDPGAELVLGWTRDTDRAEYERRVADGTLGELLRRVPVKPGDAFYLPAGTLHAIGAGIQLFETQQTSDLTYRIFDWNRVGADGKPRQLHVEKAADVLDFRATFPVATRQISFDVESVRRTIAIADARFLVEHITIDRAGAAYPTYNRPLVVMALEAPLELNVDETSTPLRPWQTAVVPAAAVRVAFTPADVAMSALVVHIAPDLERVRADAEAGGVDSSELDAFFARFRV